MRWRDGLVTVGIILVFVPNCMCISRLRHTCVICRLERVDAECLGLLRSSYAETECSLWYAAHVEPKHTHIWERSACRSRSNLFGLPMSVACQSGSFPILLLSPTTQLKAYQRFQDPREAKKVFANLTEAKTHDDWLDDAGEHQALLTVYAIEAWEEAGFPGAWDTWWDQFLAKTIEDRRDWVEWSQEGSRLSFHEWKKSRRN
ncbi:hypothetical protein ACYOEI_10425 [Singulisphaera rosea]